MGAVLVRSAFSANIKERRDCSTALFDERGRMIAQAEHIPVHLGALPDAVAAVRAHDPAPDDVFILNDPYAGGTHLPDITLGSRTCAHGSPRTGSPRAASKSSVRAAAGSSSSRRWTSFTTTPSAGCGPRSHPFQTSDSRRATSSKRRMEISSYGRLRRSPATS